MAEPITTNKSFIVPNTSDLPGAWGTSALNPDFQTIDALFGGVTTISLSSATTLLLTVPATTGVWPGFLSQSVNSLIKFTGAQTGNAVIQITLPGYYIIHNQCTGTSFVQLANQSGAGNKIGAPPGKKCHVFFDGTDMDYVNMPDPGTAYDFHTNTTSLPPWMNACTVAPYLIKNGATYSSATFPALAQYLGSTYGGNGINTFGVPDELSRIRFGVDTGATNRLTVAANGFNGTQFNASGGTSSITLVTGNLPAYTPSGNVIIGASGNGPGLVFIQGSGTINVGGTGSGGVSVSTTAPLTGNAQGGVSTPMSNVGPAIVSFLPLIKT